MVLLLARAFQPSVPFRSWKRLIARRLPPLAARSLPTDQDSLFWLWAKANKQRLDLLLCLWAAAAAAEQTAYRGVNRTRRWLLALARMLVLVSVGDLPRLQKKKKKH